MKGDKGVTLLILAAACVGGCGQKQSRLECEIREQGSPDGSLKLSATLANPEKGAGGVRDFKGTIEYGTGALPTKLEAHGMYFDYPNPRVFELVSFSQTESGKLNITVMPERAALRQRGTKAVVMTGNQTVRNGTPAVAQCRVHEPA